MLQYLKSLNCIVKPGMMLERNEVIRRYRSLKDHNRIVLTMICMTQFFMLSRNENGDLTIV